MYQEENIARNWWMNARNRGNGADSEEDNYCQKQGGYNSRTQKKERNEEKSVQFNKQHIFCQDFKKSEGTMKFMFEMG